MKPVRNIILSFPFLIFLFSCNKFIEVSVPPTQLVSQNVFTSDASATAALVGTYSDMMSSYGFASGGALSITQLAGLSADEFISYATDPNLKGFYKNNLISTNTIVDNNLWNEGYQLIYSVNAVLDGLATSTGVSDQTKNQLTGEAKFIRAFCHFYLVNLFSDIPLITSTNYKVNAVSSRTPTEKVYSQIILDLKDAQSLLPGDYSISNGEKTRPNKWAATALLARVYLYQEDWTDAKSQATALINNSSLYNLNPDLNSVFLANSSDAIWQLRPVQPGFNTQEGETFILTSAPQNLSIAPTLLSAFENGDNRKTDWIDSIIIGGQTYYFAYKYKVQYSNVLSEYSMVLRLSEQYLIRAETEAQLNDLPDAINDLNAIRGRAGLPATTATNQTNLLAAIVHERQVELFSEWGHRWLDLKRSALSDQVLGPVKSPEWQSTDTLYPIPKVEITNDPNLSQNPGY
jgi:starch-binding outer membrane protein, SusD/RagB family